VLGPDKIGNRAVLAGDRTCWFGVGEPPQTPGALHLQAQGATIASGRVALGEPEELSEDVTTAVVAGAPGELTTRGREGRRLGLRVILAVGVERPEDEEEVRAMHFANRDPLVRVALWGPRAEPLCEELGLAWTDLAGDMTALAARSFGREFGLVAGAVGDVVVIGDDGSVRHGAVAGVLRIRGALCSSIRPSGRMPPP